MKWEYGCLSHDMDVKSKVILYLKLDTGSIRGFLISKHTLNDAGRVDQGKAMSFRMTQVLKVLGMRIIHNGKVRLCPYK